MSVHSYRSVLKMLLLCVVVTFFCASPAISFGQVHTSLVEMSPAKDMQLIQSPDHVELTFDQRIHSDQFYIKVFNQNGKLSSKHSATLENDRFTLRLPLPALRDGEYTVTYYAELEDELVESDAYSFFVGDWEQQPFVFDTDAGHVHSLPQQFKITDGLAFGTRSLLYVTLIFSAGWVLWSVRARRSEQMMEQYRNVGLQLKRGLLLLFALYLFFHYKDLLGGKPPSQLYNLLFGTTVGLSWILTGALILLSFVLLFKFKTFDIIWACLLLFAQSISGHAATARPVSLTISSDFVHLLAASLWAGGLLFILLNVRKRSAWIKEFQPKFAKWALVSVIALAISGVISTISIVPSIDYLLLTTWGKLIIAKVILFALIVIVAIVVRLRIRLKGMKGASPWIRVNAVLLVVILCTVGVLTYLNPMPTNEELRWHVMGDDIHMTGQVYPNHPGEINTFIVKVWLPDGDGAPEHVEMRLVDVDKPNLPPMIPPLVPMEKDRESGFFEGFEQFNYKIEGPYLPYAGRWNVEIIVDTPIGERKEFERQMEVLWVK